jgi:Mg-chelatase subunit ChlD
VVTGNRGDFLSFVADEKKRDDAMAIGEAVNRGLSSFSPDMMFESLVKDYKTARDIYGKKLLRLLTGFDDSFIESSINIPEFQREMQQNIRQRVLRLRQEKMLDRNNEITEDAMDLASKMMYMDELDRLSAFGLGEKDYRISSDLGEADELKRYSRGDRYQDISVRKTVRQAVRRSSHEIRREDLRVFTKKTKGKISIVYALDASGSMRGEKVIACKKAGIALAYKAIEERDSVGLLAFSKEIGRELPPTRDFNALLSEIGSIRAAGQTDIAHTLRKALELFPKDDKTRHVVLISDAMPNIGENPEKETLDAASLLASSRITSSVVGIKLEPEAMSLARKVAEIGQGRFYEIKDPENIDLAVLEDYYRIA